MTKKRTAKKREKSSINPPEPKSNTTELGRTIKEGELIKDRFCRTRTQWRFSHKLTRKESETQLRSQEKYKFQIDPGRIHHGGTKEKGGKQQKNLSHPPPRETVTKPSDSTGTINKGMKGRTNKKGKNKKTHLGPRKKKGNHISAHELTSLLETVRGP